MHKFESGFFVREPAWHKLGTVLKNAPNLADGLKLAGLDWTVRQEAIFTADMAPIESHVLQVRSTDKSHLGVVGAGYKTLQNVDAFKWFEPLLQDKSAILESAGSLRNGRKVWILARLNTAAQEIVKGDAVVPYLLLAHAHDGTLAVHVQFTAIRVVCANTLGMAIGNSSNAARKGKALRLKHTKSLTQGLIAAQQTIDMAKQTWNVTAQAFRAMAAKPMSGASFSLYARDVLNFPLEEELSTRSKNTIDSLQDIFENGPGLTARSRGTVWAAYNAITDWVDHDRSRDISKGLESTWFGPGADIRARAFELAMSS